MKSALRRVEPYLVTRLRTVEFALGKEHEVAIGVRADLVAIRAALAE